MTNTQHSPLKTHSASTTQRATSATERPTSLSAESHLAMSQKQDAASANSHGNTHTKDSGLASCSHVAEHHHHGSILHGHYQQQHYAHSIDSDPHHIHSGSAHLTGHSALDGYHQHYYSAPVDQWNTPSTDETIAQIANLSREDGADLSSARTYHYLKHSAHSVNAAKNRAIQRARQKILQAKQTQQAQLAQQAQQAKQAAKDSTPDQQQCTATKFNYAVEHARDLVHFKPQDYAHGFVRSHAASTTTVSSDQVVAAVKTHAQQERKRQRALIKAIMDNQGDISALLDPSLTPVDLYDHSRSASGMNTSAHSSDLQTASAVHSQAATGAATGAASDADPHKAAGTDGLNPTSAQGSTIQGSESAAAATRPDQTHVYGTLNPSQEELSAELAATQPTFLGPSLVQAERQYEVKALQQDRGLRSAPHQEQNNADMKAQVNTSRELTLPGFGVYQAETHKILFDRNAIQLLHLDPSLTQQWLSLHHFRHLLGTEITHQVLSHLRQLRDTHSVIQPYCEHDIAHQDTMSLHQDVKNTLEHELQNYQETHFNPNFLPHMDPELLRLPESKAQSIYNMQARPHMWLGAYKENDHNASCATIHTGLSYRPYFHYEVHEVEGYDLAPYEINAQKLEPLQLQALNSSNSHLSSTELDYLSSASSTMAPVHAIALAAAMPMAKNEHTAATAAAPTVAAPLSQLNSLKMAASALVASGKNEHGSSILLQSVTTLDHAPEQPNRAEAVAAAAAEAAGKAGAAEVTQAAQAAQAAVTPTSYTTKDADAFSHFTGLRIYTNAVEGFSLDLVPYTFSRQTLNVNEELPPDHANAIMALESLVEPVIPSSADTDDANLQTTSVKVNGRSRSTFAIYLHHGPNQSEKLYLKLNAFFKCDHSLSFVSITITRIASKLFELMPHIVADSASFDWLLPTDECIYGRNYYTILGYKNNDPHIPYRHKLWQKAIIHPDDLATVRDEYTVLNEKEHGNAFELLYRSRCRDGSYIWTKGIGAVVGRDRTGMATRVLGINIDINRVLEGYEQLQNKVFTDILTGLRNRTYLITHMEQFIRAATGPMTIIFADITALKLYNDYLGHAVGDKLLCSAAILIKSAINHVNELIRISGDEIICLLPNCNESEAELVGRKIIEARQQYNKNAPIRMPVFFSIGIKTIDLSAYAGRDLHVEEKEEALGIFYQSIQDADMLMQENKRLARAEHYGLVQAYIEKSLNHPISLSDNRLF